MKNSHLNDTSLTLLKDFTCLGGDCEDTCCKGWSMQLDQPHLDKYKQEAPKFMEAVTEDATGAIMKRDPETDYCVMLKPNGWCGVHEAKGTDFLGDACHFYPRVTRALGNQRVMAATLSCPEIARLALLSDDESRFSYKQGAFERVPFSLKDYLSQSLTAEKAMQAVTAFDALAADSTISPEAIMSRIVSVAKSMENLDVASWPEAAGFYLKTAEARMLPPQADKTDPYKLLHALAGLIGATDHTINPRLRETLDTMQAQLKVNIKWDDLTIHSDDPTLSAYAALKEQWDKGAADAMAPLLRNWIRMQLATSLFPFAGMGETVYARACILAIRFTTVRLALICHMQGGQAPDDATSIRVIQSLARFLDHLGDPTFSLSIYDEAGWLKEERLMGVVEG